MQYLAHPFNDNTLRLIVCYQGALHAPFIQTAIHHLVMDVPILHASFHSKHKMGIWHVHEDVRAEECFTFLETDQSVLNAAISQSILPIHPDDRRQMHVTLCQGKETCSLVLRISHLCMDGSDAKYVLYQLLHAYELLVKGQSLADFHLKNGNRSAQQVYSHLSKEELRPLLHSPMNKVKSFFPFQDENTGENRMIVETLPPSLITAVHQKAKLAHATLNDALLCACYRAYASLDQVDEHAPISIMSMMDLRRYLPQKDSPGLANLAGSLPTCLDQVNGSFADTLHKITAQTNAMKQRPYGGAEGMPLLHGAANHLPTRFLERASSRLYQHMSVGFTNLGTLDAKKLSANTHHPTFALAGSVLKKKPNVQLCALSMENWCTLTITGQYTQADEVLLRQFLHLFHEELVQYSDH